ncbi:chemotaxis response regulator protein-glutamate methylesterase [Kineococcus gynurae]|uniref:Protein-glutamate methylesterase/protein-glutamine glutaminase n=1 Tax=Kineococcus gynurae TaxID=452979 RepID=A0ABV5LSA0_9ACTN
MPRRVRVLVVDDSAVIRKLITTVLSADADIEVVGTANDGAQGLQLIEELKPDAVTLDIEMPVLDGLQTMRQIRQRWRRLPVIMFSTLTERGASATLEALHAGASDYVTKPSNHGSFDESMRSVREQLIPRLKALTASALNPPPPRTSLPATSTPLPVAADGARRPVATGRPRALVIGSSTGGPEALLTVLQGLPATFPVPVLITQHMPPVFTKMYAQRLDGMCALKVVEAGDGEPVVAGSVYVAPGDFHMEVVRGGNGPQIRLQQGPPENFCRPAVDVMIRSAVRFFGGDLLAVILTGMGSDGRNGCREVSTAGGQIVVQDEATSVVWGMPGAVARDGTAQEVLPLDRIAEAIRRRTPGAGPARPAAPAVADPAPGAPPPRATLPARPTPPRTPLPARTPASPTPATPGRRFVFPNRVTTPRPAVPRPTPDPSRSARPATTQSPPGSGRQTPGRW